LQVPRGVHTQVPKENPLWDDPAGLEGCVSPLGEAERVRDRGGPSDARSRAYALAIPPKHSVATILGFLKGKSSIWIAQNIANKPRNFAGHKFWARGYFVSTVGANEKVIRAYIENQEKEDKRLNDLFDR
jgi:hypothetical protein